MTGVEVRRYGSVEQFQQDAAKMAAAGWGVVSQSETTGSVKAAWIILAGLAALGGAVLWIPAFLGVPLFLVAALLDRQKLLVATYRWETRNPASPLG